MVGREAGSWETHHLAGSRGRSHGPATLKCFPGSYCSNCRLQPWSTAPFPSRGRTAWGAGKSRQRGQICKSRQDVQRLLTSPANPEPTSRALASHREGTGPCDSTLQSRNWNPTTATTRNPFKVSKTWSRHGPRSSPSSVARAAKGPPAPTAPRQPPRSPAGSWLRPTLAGSAAG